MANFGIIANFVLQYIYSFLLFFAPTDASKC